MTNICWLLGHKFAVRYSVLGTGSNGVPKGYKQWYREIGNYCTRCGLTKAECGITSSNVK